MKRILVYICLLITSIASFGQVPGSWNEYFSFRNVQQLEGIDDNVFALSENGIFIYNTPSGEIQKITKINGLSTIGLTCFAYCDSTSSFLIGYSDGTLDILQYPSLNVISIPTIAQKSIYGSKKINAIVMQNDTAIIATEFGVLTFSMNTRKFITTTILSSDGDYVPAKSITIDSGTIYAATTKGIYSTHIGLNISDFATWNKLTKIPYENDTIDHIASLNGTIYYGHNNTVDAKNDSIFKIVNGKVEPFKIQMHAIKRLKTKNGNLFVVSSYSAKMYNAQEQLKISVDTTANTYPRNFSDICLFSLADIYVSDNQQGIFNQNDYKVMYPQSPQSNEISDIQYNDSRLLITEGKIVNWEGAMFDYMDYLGQWYSHKTWNTQNALCIHVPEKSDLFYYGSFGGLTIGHFKNWWEYDNIYNHTNSIIEETRYYATDADIISDITSDYNNNLWLLNEYVTSPLIAITPDNNWYSFSIPAVGKMTYEHFLIDSHSIKWIVGDGKLIAFYENKTLDDTSDDVCVQIPLTDNEGTIASRTTCIAEDLDGEIWIGTNQGIAVHSAPTRVFKDRQTISRIKIEIDGEVGYLLSSEFITCIAVDGANRKWIGTENSGIFLISENGTEQLLNFTKTNSPLPSNTITAIAINHETGEVFIGTGDGLVSYISDATVGDSEMDDITIYPNPVRETYDGNIFIKGLVADAIVKITDITGNLVKTLVANGGTAVWDGRNIYGNRVSTGIYLIYISNETGETTKISKIMFIN